MANVSEPKVKAIILTQNWGAGRIPIGTEYKLKDSAKIMKLVECDGYPYGKFVFDDNEEFNIGKYFDAFFVEIKKEMDEANIETSVYNEEAWNKADKKLNTDENSLIRKTLGSAQINESFHDMAYYDVTNIIDIIVKNKDKNIEDLSPDIVKKLYGYFIYNNYPYFTKEKLNVLFATCEFKKTKDSSIVRVIKNNIDIGYLISESGKYIFAPKNKDLKDEYRFENNNSVGFFYTAESYLDIALSTLIRYKKQFVPVYNTQFGKNNESLGYQADASIKTLLAFSCECYLKALIINNGKNIDDIKKLGHGLSVLYTSLSDEQIGYIFNFMENQGYELGNKMYHMEYEIE